MKKTEQSKKKLKKYEITKQDLQNPEILNCFALHRSNTPSPNIDPLRKLAEQKDKAEAESAAREEAARRNNNNNNQNQDQNQNHNSGPASQSKKNKK